jgi:hypothetical protein
VTVIVGSNPTPSAKPNVDLRKLRPRRIAALSGIDQDTKSGYLYVVGHANGLSTLIQSLGKVTGTFDDPVYFRWVPIPVYDIADGD